MAADPNVDVFDAVLAAKAAKQAPKAPTGPDKKLVQKYVTFLSGLNDAKRQATIDAFNAAAAQVSDEQEPAEEPVEPSDEPGA